jgi:hypothetical protein
MNSEELLKRFQFCGLNSPLVIRGLACLRSEGVFCGKFRYFVMYDLIPRKRDILNVPADTPAVRSSSWPRYPSKIASA